MITSAKEQFLLNQLFNMTLTATVQRSSTYRKNTTEKDRVDFRRDLQMSLISLSEQYRESVSEAMHCKNIEALAKKLSEKHGDVLHARRFRIGSAQKALNLYLKYMWCLERVAMPPHCPIDGIILDKVAKATDYKKTAWTKLDSITEYEEIISKAKEVAGKSPLSEWEIQFYNTTQPNNRPNAS
ncbi:MAG: hypothetical protein FD173_469 [Gallionellaceae bacterium]|nr:MAG: hypothetical protein FD173_469 [Gallionellaceae bacterium]